MASHPDRSMTDVLQDIVWNVQEIIRSEFRLARAETRDELKTAAKSGGVLATGVVTGLYAIAFLLLALMYALEILVTPWLAALIVAIAVGALAALFIALGRKRLRKVHGPQKTVRTVKENVEWTKQQMR